MIKLLKKILPDKWKSNLKSLFSKKEELGWIGNYPNWQKAKAECTGYDATIIPEKIKQAVLKVKRGEAKYERDSVTFDELYLYQPVVNALQDSIINGKLHVCDFGGSLGSSYFQHRHLFSNLNDFKWSVVEQKHYVEIGKNEIAEKELNFYFTIDDVLKNQSNQLLVLSSVLQYIEEPYSLITKLLEYNFEYIIIDRTAFIEGSVERLTKQVVPEYIYKASYPAWFFNEEKFKKMFSTKYEFINQFVNDIPSPMKIDSDAVYWKGFYLKRKNG
ncbi:MAG: methyltransferase, TIGR04325 family [Bacteroidia bacterium]|nr:methyltransferase, TIGR04325 family [Bacteroidia bacterium]